MGRRPKESPPMIAPLRGGLKKRIADLLRAHRLSLEKTQTDIGEMTGQTRAYISKIERAEENMTLDALDVLLDKTGAILELSIRSKTEDEASGIYEEDDPEKPNIEYLQRLPKRPPPIPGMWGD